MENIPAHDEPPADPALGTRPEVSHIISILVLADGKIIVEAGGLSTFALWGVLEACRVGLQYDHLRAVTGAAPPSG